MFKMGCDPEFFLWDYKKKKVVSAHPFIPGTKKEPFKVPYGAIQLDGVSAEFNIDAAETAEEFDHNIRAVLKEMRRIIPKRFGFEFAPSVVFSEEDWKKIPEEHKELGCDPDFNAVTGLANPRPDAAQRMRTGSGHIHLGWTDNALVDDADHLYDCRAVIRSIEATFGAARRTWDKDRQRENLYGKPSTYRPKKYGAEYRTFSNAWLRYPKLWPLLFKKSEETIERLRNGHWGTSLIPYPVRSMEEASDLFQIPLIKETRRVRVG